MKNDKSCRTCLYYSLPITDEPCRTCTFNSHPNWLERPKSNPYWDRICALSAKQRAKGIETYGQGLESNPDDILKRIEHLEEELIDGLMYCEWIKDAVLGQK